MEPAASRKRVLFVINSLAGGGAERVMVTLLRHSQAWRDRYTMSLALLDKEPAAYAPPDWLPVDQLDARGKLIKSVRQLRSLVRRSEPDLIVSFLTRANVSACLAAAGMGKPFIVSERVNTNAHLARGLRGSVSRLLVRLTYPRARHVLAVSQGIADDLVRLFAVRPERISVVANPVDGATIRARALEQSAVAAEPPYVVAMGRLTAPKNFAFLIDAFARADVPGRLVIMGEGPERATLERRIAALGMADRILLPGFSANPFPLIAGADCYVLPSNAEGFPNGLVEAMSLGVPVISTDCPSGPSEILAGRAQGGISSLDCAEHGLLIPCEDRAALAEGLRRYKDPALRAHYADAARARAGDFSVEASVARYWAVMETVLGAATIPFPDGQRPYHSMTLSDSPVVASQGDNAPCVNAVG